MGMALLAVGMVWQMHYRFGRQSFGVETRDMHVLDRRAGATEMAEETYRRQIGLMTGFQAGAPTLTLGVATGLARQRGDLSAPQIGQEVAIDLPAMYQHVLVMGATGEGKTTWAFSRIAKFAFQNGTSALVLDAKGVLYLDIQRFAAECGRADDVRVIGPEEGQFSVDLLDGLDPQQAVVLFRSLVAQLGGVGNDRFWCDSAIAMLRFLLYVAQAVEATPEGQAYRASSGRRIYSFGWVFSVLSDRVALAEAMRAVYRHIDRAIVDGEDIPGLDDVRAAMDMALRELIEADSSDKMRGSIIKTLETWLTGLCESPAMRTFAWAQAGNVISLSEIFNGKIVCLALNQQKFGGGAKLTSMFLKAAFYRAALLREAEIGSKACQANPVLLLIDEAQALITVGDNESKLDDSSFYNVARSAGVMCVLASQSIEALISGVGAGVGSEQHVMNLLANLRSRLLLRVEDPKTLDYVAKLAGEQPMSVSGVGDASVEQRILRTAWKPLEAEDYRFWSPPTRLLLRLPFLANELRQYYFPFSRGNPTGFANRMAQHAPLYGYCANAFGIDPVVHDHDREDHMRRISEEMSVLSQLKDQRESMRYGMDDRRGSDVQVQRVIQTSDIEAMGRYHALAIVQRGGAQRLDVIRIEHDFG